MADPGFLYPVSELLGGVAPPGSRIVIPEQGPTNAPLLVNMLMHMHPRHLNVLGAIVAVELVAEQFENICGDLAAEHPELDTRVAARVVENMQARLVNRIEGVTDLLRDTAETADQLETIYVETVEPVHATAMMIAAAAHHCVAATSILMMGRGQLPQQDQPIMLEAVHAVMFAAQSRSESQPHPSEGGLSQKKIDLLQMTEPSPRMLEFLHEWWALFRERVTTPERPAAPSTALAEVEPLTPAPLATITPGANLRQQLQEAWTLSEPGDGSRTHVRQALEAVCGRLDHMHDDLRLQLHGNLQYEPGTSSREHVLRFGLYSDQRPVRGEAYAKWFDHTSDRPTLSLRLDYLRTDSGDGSLQFTATSERHADPRVIADIAAAAWRMAALVYSV